MNYLETGLPHTDFFPKKTHFHPPRSIPLCTLGRKYLGLEPVSKREIETLIKRLCQPKRLPEQDDVIKTSRPVRPGTGRFVGQKRMSSFQIEKMVERLYNRRATKDYEFVDITVEANDIYNMTNRDDDSDDSDDEVKSVKNMENSLIRRKSIARAFNHPVCQRLPGQSRDNSFIAWCSEKHATVENRKISETECIVNVQNAFIHNSNESGKVEIPKLKLNGTSKSYNGVTFQSRETNQNCAASTKEQSKFYADDITNTPCKGLTRSVPNRCFPRRVQSEYSRRTEVIKRSHFDTPSRASISDVLSINNDLPTRLDSSRSPRNKFPKIEDTKPVRRVSTPSEESLIDKVATYNRSPRLQYR